MRVKYIGKDNRVRISKANRFKFLPDGFQSTDPRNERDEDIQGSLIVFHTYRAKGGKLVVVSVPDDFKFDFVQMQILQNGWVDLSMYPVVSENHY